MTNWAPLLFLLSLLLLLYVLIGYPLLLAAMARFLSRPVRKEPLLKSVSILLPVRNGERWISAKLDSILQLDYPRHLVEILVVSDGSTDRTDDLVTSFTSAGVRLISTPPRGKASALNSALAEARHDILLFTDVRQQLHPDALRRLVDCFADPSVGVVSGELVIRAGDRWEEEHVGLYWRYEKWIRKNLSRIDSILGATGAIYAMRRVLAVQLPPDTLLDDVHLPLAAFFRGHRVIFEPEAKAFDEPASLHSEFRRKVRTQAGVYQIIRSFPALLGPQNRMWFHFVSHKLARLLLPFALLLAAVSSFGLPHPWAVLSLSGQAGFYGLALLDPWIPERLPVKRVTSLVRTFAALMAAALFALSIFIAPARSLWTDARSR